MQFKNIVFKHNEIILTMWFDKSINLLNKNKFLIFCYGLPSHPYQHNPAKVERLLEEGFILIYPYYKGTWASDGIMSWEGCVDSILETISFIKNKNAKSAYDNKKTEWKFDEISLVGGSFGASIALVAGAKSKDIKNITAIAGPTNWRDHSRIPEESSEPIEDLYDSIIRGWKNLWRIPSKEEWERLVTGKADINPIDYIKELSDKNVFLIHGKNDSVVSLKRSEDLFEKLNNKKNHRLLILEEGHLGNNVIGNDNVIEEFINFHN